MTSCDRRNHAKSGVIFWFRNDLRLHDQLALEHAIDQAQSSGGWLLPIYVHDERLNAPTSWGFDRTGKSRDAWTKMALDDLSRHLSALGSTLIQAHGDPIEILVGCAHDLGMPLLVCEEICAPEELNLVDELRHHGLNVQTVWQSTLMSPQSLPFLPEDLPDRFTSFRQLLEKEKVLAAAPLGKITALTPLPASDVMEKLRLKFPQTKTHTNAVGLRPDSRSSFPWGHTHFHGGETAALAHLAQYCRRGLPHTYKSTRNGLIGVDYSSKWSPWLATGALSVRTAWSTISDFKAFTGASEGPYWLGFELLWRDYFRWLHRKHGRKLYAARGLTDLAPAPHSDINFQRWCSAKTGNVFIDAGMKELEMTGYISNRMRQNVASYLIHDLACDWRAGAAWFEANLIDYDVYSNQGNWLYLSGRGTDPRSNRRFNPLLQANTYDPDGNYRALWTNP